LDEGQCAEDIECSSVAIDVSRSTVEKPSSMITLKNEIDFHWEEKFYMGHLVSVHKSSSLLAYAVVGKYLCFISNFYHYFPRSFLIIFENFMVLYTFHLPTIHLQHRGLYFLIYEGIKAAPDS